MRAILLRPRIRTPSRSRMTLGITLDGLECDCETSKSHSCGRGFFIRGKLHNALTTTSRFQHNKTMLECLNDKNRRHKYDVLF